MTEHKAEATTNSRAQSEDDGRKLISVVVPAYNESECIKELARRLAAVFDRERQYGFEVLIVENGSTDDTYDRLVEIREADPRFKIIRLARNFRMDGGLTAGMAYARGDAVVLMTADLQDPPEVIPEFIRKWEAGYDHVHGVVTERQGTGPIRRLNSQLFYLVANKLTGNRIPRNVSDFRLVDRKVYDTINRMPERNRFVRGLFAWAGFKTIGVEHPREPRYAGESKASTLKVFDLATKGILAHSYVPLKLASFLGVMLAGLSFVSLGAFTARAFLVGVPFPGFGTIVSLLLLLFGFLFCLLGVIGEYIALIYEEVKQRPNFVISETQGIMSSLGELDK